MTKPDSKHALPPAQPADSKISFVPYADSMTFLIPRSGLNFFTGFGIVFSALWNVIAWPIFLSLFLKFHHPLNPDEVVPAIVLPLFPLIGIISIFVTVQMIFRKATLVATRELLVFRMTGPFHKKKLQWLSGDITSITAGISNVRNLQNEPLLNLQIRSRTDKFRGLLTGRTDAEIQWLAATLSDFYKRAPLQ